MGALDIITKANIALKNLLGKSQTDNAREVGNEPYGINLNISSSNVYIDNINSNPISAITNGVAEYIEADLELETGSNGHAYFAIYPIGHSNQGERIFNIISTQYGNSYEVIPYTDTGMTDRIFVGDNRNWIFQYQSGIFYQEFTNLITPKKIKLYRYVGKYLSDGMSGATSIAWTRNEESGQTYLINNNDSVGIGLDQPTEKLDVAGNVLVRDDIKVSGDTYLLKIWNNTESSIHIDSSGKTIIGTLYRSSLYFTGLTTIDEFDDYITDACIWDYFLFGYNNPVYNNELNTNLSNYNKFTINDDTLIGVNDSFIVKVNLINNTVISNIGVGTYTSPKKTIQEKDGYYVGTNNKIVVLNQNGTLNHNINFGSTEYSSYASKLIGNYMYITTQYNFYIVDVSNVNTSDIITGITFTNDSGSTILNFSNKGQYFYVPKFYNDGLLTYSNEVSIIWTDNNNINIVGNITTDVYGPKSTFVNSVNGVDYLFISSLSDVNSGRTIVYDITTPQTPIWIKTVELDFIPNDILVEGFFIYITSDDGKLRQYLIKDINNWLSLDTLNVSSSVLTFLNKFNNNLILIGDKIYNYTLSRYGARAGSIMSCWDSETNVVDYNSVSTRTTSGDGSLSDFDVVNESNKIKLKSYMDGNWFVRFSRRFI